MTDDYRVLCLTMGMAATNGYFFYKESYDANDGKHHGIFFDPPVDGRRIYEALTERDLVIDNILLTHGHFDHIGGAKELRELSGAKIYCFEKEKELCMNINLNGSASVGLDWVIDPDYFFKDNEIFSSSGMSCKVLYTPGHTIGGCSFYFEEAEVLFSGDTLFAESVGRTDFPTGSMSTLVRSIKERLFVLPDDTVVYPGHMGHTTIGFEKENNPFLQ